MAGIVGSAMGQAIANVGTTIGGFMSQSARDDERRRELEERRAYESERDALYKRTADQQAAARSGGGGASGRVGALTDEEKDYEAAAMGMTRPQYERFMSAQRSGDMSAFKRDTQKTTTTESGDPYNPEVAVTTVKDYPPGFEQEFASKQKTLARLREERSFGKDYKEVVEGRQGMQNIGLVNEAMAKPDMIPTLGASKAAVKGEGMFDGDSNTTRNKFTGKSEATAVGKSVIGENAAQGDKARADAAGSGKVDINGVAANSKILMDLAQAAEDRGDPAAAKQYREKAAQASLNAIDKKVPPPAKPAAAQFKEGETREIQAGPNKGKTARWDGKGWVLTNSRTSSGVVVDGR